MTTKRKRVIGPVLALACLAGAAAADPLPTVTLPTLALDPAPQPSIWSGFSVGSEVFAISGRGGKGGFGGDVFAGYDHEFANNVVLGVQGGAGYTPAFFGPRSLKGFDYASTDVHLGYDMGRLEPFVTAGVLLARPHLGPGGGPFGSDPVNDLMNGSGELRAATRVGVGANYALTNNLTIGVAVSAVSGPGLLLP